jgi:hypothetical protein
MKKSCALAISTLIFITPLTFARDVGPVGVGSPDQSDIATAKVAGLKLGKAYSVNRDILLRASWQPDTGDVDGCPLFKGYPEISCGTGYDAVCQALFSKDGKSLLLTVDQNKKNLPLVHVSKE